MKQPLNVIVEGALDWWRQIDTQRYYRIVWASPHEVAAISDSDTWLGSAVTFVREFERIDGGAV
jgi:hypothetical protein